MSSPRLGLLLALAAPHLAAAGCTAGHVQCYVDDSARILGTAAVYVGALTPEYCASRCSQLGKRLAGVENGQECYCADALRPDAQTGSGCQMDCSGGDGVFNAKCGGFWRIGVYNFTCSGPPVPQPGVRPYMVNPCTDPSSGQADLPWCDPTLPVDTRVSDMLARMTLAEKIGNLDTTAPAIESLGLYGYNWWSEGTHGISHVRNDATYPYETNFAFPITTAMAFNRSLWRATGGQIGREARAFMNGGNAFSTYWAPVINLAREPRWGRNIETPGEDPYLSGEYASAFVGGFERSEDDPTHLQASACCKHYVANSMEDSTVAGEHHARYEFNANISMRDLVDSYLLPFQACVEKGKVSSLMCSYNAVNGVPSCANDWLLNTVAREAWGFDGYITSDCDADSDVYNSHHYTRTPEEAVAAVLHAGTDVDCTSFVGEHAQAALDKGLISESDIDARLAKLFRVRMRLAHFDPPTPLSKIAPSDVCSEAAIALARDGVAQGAALLKNDEATLPLSTDVGSVAVIGPNANLSRAISSYYGGNSCGGRYDNMVDAISRHAAVTSALGVPSVSSADTSGVAAAAALAAKADVTVLVLGSDLSVAREGHDAVDIALPEGQAKLSAAVAKAARRPVIVVTLTAVPYDLTPLLKNPKVGAVLHAGQPSVQTAGVADVLFGIKSPAGRTIQTVYPSNYQHEISIFDFNMRPGPSTWPRPDCKGPPASCPRGTNPGRTYRFYTGEAVVPFGFGLSYSTFEYTLLSSPRGVDLSKLTTMLDHDGPSFPSLDEVPLAGRYCIEVRNSGSVDADDAVLGFISAPGAGTAGAPIRELFGFERVHVAAGQTVRVWLSPSLMAFTRVGVRGERSPLEGEYRLSFGVQAQGMGYAEARVVARLEPRLASRE